MAYFGEGNESDNISFFEDHGKTFSINHTLDLELNGKHGIHNFFGDGPTLIVKIGRSDNSLIFELLAGS